MQSFRTSVIIRADRARVYKALTTQADLQSWWTDCKIDPVIGGNVTFYFGDMYISMQIEKLVYDREVVWRCIDQYFKFENVQKTNEWVGTIIDFRLVRNEDHTTIVEFLHEGLTPELGCYNECEQLWTYLLNLGLKKYVENKSE